jgi:hypothetical protein
MPSAVLEPSAAVLVRIAGGLLDVEGLSAGTEGRSRASANMSPSGALGQWLAMIS